MRTHTGERPFECEQCGKRFSQSGHLARHKLTHTGKTPYPCPICGKGFSQKKRLVDHARTHTGERPFRCHYCPKSFTHAEYLKSHLHTHREEKYVCPVCRLMFSRKYKMVEHMRTHSGEWPLVCAHCNSCFISKENIAYHIHSQHFFDIMGDGVAPVEESHISSLDGTIAGFCESEPPPYCTTEKEETVVKPRGTLTEAFAFPSDEEELHNSHILTKNLDAVVQKHNPPQHTSAISETVSSFIKEETISDEEDSTHLASDGESTDLLPQLFPDSGPKLEPTVLIKEEIDTLVEDPLCSRSDLEVNTSETSLTTGTSSEIKLAATNKDDAASGLEKYPFIEQVISETTSKEQQMACVKAEVTPGDKYLKFLQSEGVQDSLMSGSAKTSDTLDEDIFTSLESVTSSKGSVDTLVCDISGKSPVAVTIKEELNSSEEYPLCLRNDAVCESSPTPLAQDISRKMQSVTNFSVSTATVKQFPLYLGKDIVHKTLLPPSISGSSTFAKSTSEAGEQSMSDGGPLCLKSGIGCDNLSPNIFSEISSGTKKSTTVQNPVSNSEVPLCLKRGIKNKSFVPSFIAKIDNNTGPKTEEYLVTNLIDSSYFVKSTTCKAVPIDCTSSTIQKMKQNAIIKKDRLTVSEHPLCLKRNTAADDLPPSHLPAFVSEPMPNIAGRKDLVASLESPLCLKSGMRDQSLPEPFVTDIDKIAERFLLPVGTTLSVCAPGDKQLCNMSDALVSYQQMLYDKLVSGLQRHSENNNFIATAASLESSKVRNSKRPADITNCSIERLKNPVDLKRLETCVEWNSLSSAEKLDETKYVNAINTGSIIVHSSYVGKATENEPSSEKLLIHNVDGPYKQQHITALHNFSTVKKLMPSFQGSCNVVSTGSKVADNVYLH